MLLKLYFSHRHLFHLLMENLYLSVRFLRQTIGINTLLRPTLYCLHQELGSILHRPDCPLPDMIVIIGYLFNLCLKLTLFTSRDRRRSRSPRRDFSPRRDRSRSRDRDSRRRRRSRTRSRSRDRDRKRSRSRDRDHRRDRYRRRSRSRERRSSRRDEVS